MPRIQRTTRITEIVHNIMRHFSFEDIVRRRSLRAGYSGDSNLDYYTTKSDNSDSIVLTSIHTDSWYPGWTPCRPCHRDLALAMTSRDKPSRACPTSYNHQYLSSEADKSRRRLLQTSCVDSRACRFRVSCVFSAYASAPRGYKSPRERNCAGPSIHPILVLGRRQQRLSCCVHVTSMGSVARNGLSRSRRRDICRKELPAAKIRAGVPSTMQNDQAARISPGRSQFRLMPNAALLLLGNLPWPWHAYMRCRVLNVPLGVNVEGVFALLAAETVGLAFEVLGEVGCEIVEFHPANGIYLVKTLHSHCSLLESSRRLSRQSAACKVRIRGILVVSRLV